MSALGGIRVLVLDDTHASLVLGRCLAGFGASVLRLEPAVEGLLRGSSGTLMHFGAGQMSAVREHVRSRQIERLAASSDLVVDLGHSPGPLVRAGRITVVRQLGGTALAAANRAVGHFAAVNRDAGGRPSLLPGNQPEYLLGLAAAIAAMRGLEVADLTGHAQHVTVSQAAAVLAALPPSQAHGAQSAPAPPLVGCADGWVVAAAPGTDDRELYDLWQEAHGKLTRDGTRRQIFQSAQDWRLPFAMVLSHHELAEDPHFARTTVRRVRLDGRAVDLLGGPARLSRDPWQMRPAALLGEHQELLAAGWPGARSGTNVDHGRPLRVVDLTRMWSGPLCTRLLADMGAEVIRIESRAQSDVFGEGPLGELLRRGKQRRELDLRNPAERVELERLLADADVCIENFSPRVLGNLGLGREQMAARFPRLLIVSLPGYGSGGQYSGYLAYGAAAEAMVGLAAINGASGTPRLSAGAYGDPVAALHATFAVLVALRGRRHNGQGELVEVPLVEGLAQTIGHLIAGSDPDGSATRGEIVEPASLPSVEAFTEPLWRLDAGGTARDCGPPLNG